MRDKKRSSSASRWWMPAILLTLLLLFLATWLARTSRPAPGPANRTDREASTLVLRSFNAPRRLSNTGAAPTTPAIRLGTKAYLLDGYPDIPEGPAKAVIDKLNAAAHQGDSHAALLIYLKIDQCFRAFADQNEPDALVVPAEALGSVDAALEEQRQRRSQCDGLTGQDYANRGQWLSLSADLGNPFAQLTYSLAPAEVLGPLAEILRQPERVAEYKHRTIAHLHNAAANGNVNALERLSQLYSDGYLAPADPVRARSYQLAARRADPRTEQPDAEEANKRLDSKQQAEAARMAKDIYRECCEIK